MASEQEPTDLGKDVERAIEEFWLNCQQHGDPKKLAMIDCAPCRIAKGFLESAIRARINDRPEPTQPAEPDPTHVPHVHWCKATHSAHRDCQRLGMHRCGCGATQALEVDGESFPWRGGIQGTNDERYICCGGAKSVGHRDHCESLKDTDCKPQHIFERKHVGDRTSEHSLSWLMDTSPAHLLKLERLSNTVYVLLGHRDPEKLAAWINRAHDIANRAAGL